MAKKPNNVNKRKRDLMSQEVSILDLKDNRLTPEHEMFVLFYTALGQETFGNSTRSYMKAYGYPAKVSPARYNVARVIASRLLANVSVQKKISFILRSYHTNEIVDQERAFVMGQRGNLVAKITAIKTYDELKGRITRKLKVSGGVKADLNEEQMLEMAQLVQEKLTKKKK